MEEMSFLSVFFRGLSARRSVPEVCAMAIYVASGVKEPFSY